jgi:flavin reductase (DIM6/NTAB) family NADH-FMN oxidoreductase RutF
MKPDNDPERQLAAALGRIPSGIFVVTVAQGDVETGMLASWVQQCSFRPPRITLAIQPQRDIASLLRAGSRFGLNILESSQTDMVVHFGKGFPLGQPAFESLSVERVPGIGMIVLEALAFLSCRVVERVAAGDHDMFIADLEAGRVLDDGQPMIHVRKNGLHY